ncbi:Flp family type IVb pilin [Novosphingobium lentum]|uniref:Flp family type IVb pilin n=1 Tax=Novosphingobium lentum TaxID=145287 RepID=UPI000A717801|nr:Flp family type IVb pilin [Novosphingobium lentum]
MKSLMSRILRDRSAATAIEYGLLVGLLGIAMTFGLRNITNSIYNMYHTVDNHTTAALAR